MKIDVVPSIVQMEPEVLKNLVTEVKETIAFDLESPRSTKRRFTATDLWNIRRLSRTAADRLRK